VPLLLPAGDAPHHRAHSRGLRTPAKCMHCRSARRGTVLRTPPLARYHIAYAALLRYAEHWLLVSATAAPLREEGGYQKRRSHTTAFLR